MEGVGPSHPINKLKAKSKPGQSVAEKNAADWNRPGGGYEQWKKGDAEREKKLPIGSTAPVEDEEENKPAKPSWMSK